MKYDPTIPIAGHIILDGEEAFALIQVVSSENDVAYQTSIFPLKARNNNTGLPNEGAIPVLSVPFHADSHICRELIRVYLSGYNKGFHEARESAPQKRPEDVLMKEIEADRAFMDSLDRRVAVIEEKLPD